MTPAEMQWIILAQYYENTLALLAQQDPNDHAKRQEILHEAACVFAVNCEKLPRSD